MTISKNLIKGKGGGGGGTIKGSIGQPFLCLARFHEHVWKKFFRDKIPINCQEFLNIFCKRLSCSRPVFEVGMQG